VGVHNCAAFHVRDEAGISEKGRDQTTGTGIVEVGGHGVLSRVGWEREKGKKRMVIKKKKMHSCVERLGEYLICPSKKGGGKIEIFRRFRKKMGTKVGGGRQGSAANRKKEGCVVLGAVRLRGGYAKKKGLKKKRPNCVPGQGENALLGGKKKTKKHLKA